MNLICLILLYCCVDQYLAIDWQPDNWALGCDFYGNDFDEVQARPEKCGPICESREPCSHFTWNNKNGGTCFLKKGPIRKANAIITSDKSFVCGFNFRAHKEQSRRVTIDLFEHKDNSGNKHTVTIEAKRCHNLDGFHDRASSINTNGACVYVYENADCKGRWDQISPVSSAHNNLDVIGFNDIMSSIELCSNYDNNVIASWWTPTFNFDRAGQCYPAHPSTNDRCLDFDSNAPSYYEARECHDTYRIQYWLFYGWQKGCVDFLEFGTTGGKHDNDWEHVTVNFRRCDGTWCISSITFSQHGGWYTRKYQGKSSLNVFVGKVGHGNYHNTCCGLNGSFRYKCQSLCTTVIGVQCDYFNDFRNPGQSWRPHNLQPISNAFESNEKIRSHWERDSCAQEKCRKDGCKQNESEL